MPRNIAWSTSTLSLMALAATFTPAASQTPDPIFAKKAPINLYIGYAQGGSYDLYARLIARHIQKHLPNQPPVLGVTMAGAGSLQAANYLYKVAPKDGTALGVVGETIPMEQALKNPGVQYDAGRFTYIGRVASSNNIQLVWHLSKAQSVEDAKTIEMAVAGTGPANLAETLPKILNVMIGTKFKVVSGYPSSGPGMLAMERGEVDGTGTSWAAVKAQKQEWLRDKKIKVIFQALPERAAELPDVPAIVEFAKTPEDKQMLSLYASGGALGRYVIAPPDLPPEIANALRRGLMAMTKDPEFLADTAKSNLDVEPATHDKLEAVVKETLQISDSVRARVREIFKQ